MERIFDTICRKAAEEKYGERLPLVVEERLTKELSAVRKQKSGEDFLWEMKKAEGYTKRGKCFFFRGCTGSAFIAWLLGMTEVNPLPAHYACPECKYSVFETTGEIMWTDLPDAYCPVCGRKMRRDGFDLPPEFFFGLDGEKQWSFPLCTDSINCIYIERLKSAASMDWRAIPLDDKETIEWIAAGKGAGLPEKFNPIAGEILQQNCEKNTFDHIVRIFGLVHGEGTWDDNGHNLLQEGRTLAEIICFREDIFSYFTANGIECAQAFHLAEKIRKGIGLTNQEAAMLHDFGIPQWYIASCRKIEYLLPKAQTISLAMNAFRLSYYKVHFPKTYKEITEGDREKWGIS